MNNRMIIGLEVHVELKTKSKMFCGVPPNILVKNQTRTLVLYAWDYPGPPLSKQASDRVVYFNRPCLNCEILNHSKFDRKNYFYRICRKATKSPSMISLLY